MKSAKVQPISIMMNVQEQEQSVPQPKNKKLVSIQFEDISYSVNYQNPQTNAKENKQILKGLTGICPGGQVTAILGGSGAGKTTLLNILACRVPINNASQLSGKVSANGQEYNYQTFQNFSAYVMQNDILMETMTPKEIFQFAAHLMYNDTEIQNQKVIETIKAMKLERCQNSLIGGTSFKGISGGERKRTSIGFELVSNPTCIILDEPTSGLDSFTAFQIIFELQQLAKQQNRTVLFTIHSPSTDIFYLFDQVMLLVGGKFIYQGPRKQIINHFDQIGFACPKTSNPMDYYLSIMQGSNNQNDQTLQSLYLAYDELCHKQVIQEINQRQNQHLQLRHKETNVFQEIKHLCYRNILVFKRDPMQLRIKIAQTIFQGLLLGGVFWNIANTGEKVSDLLQISGCLFFCSINLAISAILSIILTFPVEREVFLREESSKLYTIFSYFVSKQIVEIPLSLVLPVVQALISYWMCSFNTAEEAILMHLFVSILIYLWASGLGIVIGCIFNDLKALMGIAPWAVMPYILFSGFFANPKFFYSWTRWIQYASPITFSFEAISRIQYKDQVYDADPIELFDFKFGTWTCIYVLIGFSIFFRLIGLLALYILKQKQQ